MERMKDEGRIKNQKLRSLRSLQNGNENRGQLFALTRSRIAAGVGQDPSRRIDGHAVEIFLISKGFSQFACRKGLFWPSENTTVAVLPNNPEKK
jgi:hypothetical protein